MSSYYQELKQKAAAWILRKLSSNNEWYAQEKDSANKSAEKNYFFVPLVEIAQVSRKFDLSTLRDASYLLYENGHAEIWGDDFNPYGLLIKVSDKGVEAEKKAFYDHKKSAGWFKRGLSFGA